VAHAVDDEVVDDPAGVRCQEGVLRLPVREAVDVVREHRLEELGGGGALDVELAHVRDVERARLASNREVLGDEALVLDGHLPARERDHPRSRRDVPLEQRRPAEGRAHGRDSSAAAEQRRSESRPGPAETMIRRPIAA
jgi:hypothetical protein